MEDDDTPLTSEFSVYWWDPADNYYTEKRFVPAAEAMECVVDLIQRPAAKAGIIIKVMITDGGDCCVFEWKNGEGVVFPPPMEKKQ